MKHFVWLGLCVMLLTACEKYKLNQPAYLNFHWALTNQNQSVNKYAVTGGTFYLNSFQVTGDRAKGDDIDITRDIPSSLVSFTKEGALGVSMDVPVGEYQSFCVYMNVPKDDTPCMTLVGTYNTGSDILPLRIEWSDPKKLPFSPANGFTLKKKKNYKVTMAIDIDKLFSKVSSNQWSSADFPLENGQPTLIINKDHNESLYNDIEDKLQSSLYLTVE